MVKGTVVWVRAGVFSLIMRMHILECEKIRASGVVGQYAGVRRKGGGRGASWLNAPALAGVHRWY